MQANKGKALEDLIDYANIQYRQKGIAVISKVPTPWVVNYDRRTGRVRYAFPDKDHPKMVDYVGHVGGYPVAFDAKMTAVETRFDLKNIEKHQIEFLRDWSVRGLAFLVVEFSKKNEIFCVPFSWVMGWWDASRRGGRKSIPYEDFKREWIVRQGRGIVADYLDVAERLEGIGGGEWRESNSRVRV